MVWRCVFVGVRFGGVWFELLWMMLPANTLLWECFFHKGTGTTIDNFVFVTLNIYSYRK